MSTEAAASVATELTNALSEGMQDLEVLRGAAQCRDPSDD